MMNRHRDTALSTVVVSCFLSLGVAAIGAQVATLEDRVAGANSVVVGTARNVMAEWRENAHGDRIIVSHVELEVNETLKGTVAKTVQLDVDGGTLDGVTLEVSGMRVLRTGERAVVFLEAPQRGVYTPYLRGQGILHLDEHDVVRGSTLRLADVRTRVRGR